MLKEAWDDIQRFLRDREINSKEYMKVGPDGGEITISSQSIKVGDIIKVNQNERVPADLVMLYTTEEETGDVFIRTDQLDGETDWKLRRAI